LRASAGVATRMTTAGSSRIGSSIPTACLNAQPTHVAPSLPRLSPRLLRPRALSYGAIPRPVTGKDSGRFLAPPPRWPRTLWGTGVRSGRAGSMSNGERPLDDQERGEGRASVPVVSYPHGG